MLYNTFMLSSGINIWKSCSLGKAPILKSDKISNIYRPQNDDEKNHINVVSYVLVVGSLMYTQAFTWLDIVRDDKNPNQGGSPWGFTPKETRIGIVFPI